MNLYYWLNDYMDMKDVNSVHRSWDILNNLINAENVTLYILPCLLTDANMSLTYMPLRVKDQ
jgi:hypothetical protein